MRLLVVLSTSLILCSVSLISGTDAQTTDLSAAAKYLDQKQADWFNWRGSSRGDTKCISCHTNATYTVSRLAISDLVSDNDLSIYSKTLVKNAKARVAQWEQLKHFYGGARTGQSKGTESVLNALILAKDDAHEQRRQLSETSRKAFQIMWNQQQTDGDNAGAWEWLDFGLQPWESKDGVYYGAALAAIAVGQAPGKYADEESIQDHVKALRKYLLRNFPEEENDEDMSLYHQAYLVWASNELDGLLNASQQKSAVQRLFARQNEDGGWALSQLGEWKRIDGSEAARSSDGYATGLVVYVALRSGHSSNEPKMKKAIQWLRDNFDDESGTWVGISANKDRSNASERVKGFMTSAATALSALAMAEYEQSKTTSARR